MLTLAMLTLAMLTLAMLTLVAGIDFGRNRLW